jgi:hypothetical protein
LQPKQHQKPRKAGRQRFRPRLEVLEDRTVPSTLTVSRSDDNWKVGQANDQSLRATIYYASAGDTIQVGVGVSKIHLTQGEILIDKNLQIFSPTPGDPLGLAIFGAGTGRVFEISAGADVEFSSLTITHGNQIGDGKTAASREGGGILNHGRLNLDNVLLFYNSVVGDAQGGGQGGGLYNDGGSVSIEDSSLISENTATGEGHVGDAGAGGGIFNNLGVLELERSTVASNTAEGAEGQGSMVAGAAAFGGGVFNFNGTLYIDECSISGNEALGGGVHGPGDDSGSGGSAYGGGIYSSGGLAQLTKDVIENNEAEGGSGGVFGVANGGNGIGGGMGVGNGTLVLFNSQFNDNWAGGGNGGATSGNGGVAGGGGLDFYGPDQDLMIDAQFDGNTASGGDASAGGGSGGDSYGGGMSIQAAVVKIPDATVMNNRAQGGAGGDGAGIGGSGQGGGMFFHVQTVSFGGFVEGNSAYGGPGGQGSYVDPQTEMKLGGAAGVGGDGDGGGVYLASGDFSLGVSRGFAEGRNQFISNEAIGGSGGNASTGLLAGRSMSLDGGLGGNGHGGGIFSYQGSVSFSDAGQESKDEGPIMNSNLAQGGSGGIGGTPANNPADKRQPGRSGNGGEGAGGAIFVRTGTLAIKAAEIGDNDAFGGSGQNSGASVPSGVSGGHGGNALGGAIFTTGKTLVVVDSQFQTNRAFAEGGGDGNGAGVMGNGGEADGGACFINLNQANALFFGDEFLQNSAEGGMEEIASATDKPGAPGQGGAAFGGALVLNGNSIQIVSTWFDSNFGLGGQGNNGAGSTALAGDGIGGNGGRGGDAWGGAVAVLGGNVSIVAGSMASNHVEGGDGGAGGAVRGFGVGGNGGNGGSANGGAIAGIAGSTFVLMESVSGNFAMGGDSGRGGVVSAPEGGNGPKLNGTEGKGGNGEGGGLYLTGNADVSDSTFDHNKATGGASALGNGSNTGDGKGGAFYVSAGSLLMTNSTVAANQADVDGTGLYVENGAANLTNDTIAYNNPLDFVGSAVSVHSKITLVNTLIAKNLGSSDPDIFTSKPSNITDGTHNLIGIAGSSVAKVFKDPSDLVGTTAKPLDPMIGQLANNGGPTETIALLPGSKAINAGKTPVKDPITGANLTMDQRGFARPSGGKNDIGAYEAEPIAIQPPGLFGEKPFLIPGLIGNGLFSAFLLDLLPSRASYTGLTRTLVAIENRAIKEILGATDLSAGHSRMPFGLARRPSGTGLSEDQFMSFGDHVDDMRIRTVR